MKQFNEVAFKGFTLNEAVKEVFNVNKLDEFSVSRNKENTGGKTLVNIECGCKFMTLITQGIKKFPKKYKEIKIDDVVIAVYDREGKRFIYDISPASIIAKGSEADFFKWLLEQACEIELEGITMEEFLEKKAKERKARNAEAISKILGNRIHTELEARQDDLDKAEKKLPELRKKFIDKLQEIKLLSYEINKFDEIKDTIIAEQREKIEAIFDMKTIKYVDFDGNILKIYTNEIFIPVSEAQARKESNNWKRWAGKWLMGCYRIEIDLNAQTRRFFNLDRQLRGFSSNHDNHPHVRTDGSSCAGNSEAAYAEAFGNHDIASLVAISVQWLQSVNGMEGHGLGNWPKVEDHEGNALEWK